VAQQQGIATAQSLFLGPIPEISRLVKMKRKMKRTAKRKIRRPAEPRPGNSPAPEDYLSIAQLAIKLNRGERTIGRWMHDGLLPYLKVGHFVYFKWDMVDQALSKNCLITK
jgi:hypothetical protein